MALNLWIFQKITFEFSSGYVLKFQAVNSLARPYYYNSLKLKLLKPATAVAPTPTPAIDSSGVRLRLIMGVPPGKIKRRLFYARELTQTRVRKQAVIFIRMRDQRRAVC